MAKYYRTFFIGKPKHDTLDEFDSRLTELSRQGARPVYFHETENYVRVTFEINDK